MKKFSCFTFFIYNFLLVLFTIRDVSLDTVESKDNNSSNNNNQGNQGLYNASDHVIILNTTNFKSSVYGSKSSWLVEFYNSWCGHCLRYAPVWKSLAKNILSWTDIVKVAAIDCADDDNNPICREYEVMHYPTLKFFPVNAKSPSLGLVIDKGKDVASTRKNLVHQLEIEEQEGRGLFWPNIVPYRRSELDSIWKEVNKDVKYSFLIFEKPDSHIGSDVILDFQKVTEIHIRRVTSENELLCVIAKVKKFPSLILLERNGAQKSLTVKAPTREGVKKSIQNWLTSMGIKTDLMETMEEYPEYKIKPEETEKPKVSDNTVDKFGDVVFQIDLEKALRYSIFHEIPLSKRIDGEKLIALKAYLNILATYFPMKHNGVVYLSALYDIVKEKRNITGQEFRQLVTTIETEFPSIHSGNLEWIGCKGSSRTYRGYPCGLWTMFHMLTVNFAVQNFDEMKYDPVRVLRAMYGYIKNFFGCADCAQHFVKMANENKIFELRNEDENVLWLWRAHNQVNARLSGDLTEDPYHKKIQYPAAKDCPTCRDKNGKFREDEVLIYLKNKYRYESINFYKSSIKSASDVNNSTRIRRDGLTRNPVISQKKLGWDFTIFDISICVVLYIISATILILVCIKFAVKRSYKRKVYIRSLFGKV